MEISFKNQRLITFFSSMIITNGVALITFVPITIIIGKKVDINIFRWTGNTYCITSKCYFL